MSKIDCGEPSFVPCRCDPITGCGHLAQWHRVTERWVAKCLVPGCNCTTDVVCQHIEGFDGKQFENVAKEIAAMGIAL